MREGWKEGKTGAILYEVEIRGEVLHAQTVGVNDLSCLERT